MELGQARLIDLKDWERSGGGGTGWSYINRNDSSIMLKLNKKEIPEEVSYHEYLISNTLYGMGISCPRIFDFVSLAFLARYTPAKVVEYIFLFFVAGN